LVGFSSQSKMGWPNQIYFPLIRYQDIILCQKSENWIYREIHLISSVSSCERWSLTEPATRFVHGFDTDKSSVRFSLNLKCSLVLNCMYGSVFTHAIARQRSFPSAPFKTPHRGCPRNCDCHVYIQ
jgi:hypothetical protein